MSASVGLVVSMADHGAASPLWKLEINSTEVFYLYKVLRIYQFNFYK